MIHDNFSGTKICMVTSQMNFISLILNVMYVCYTTPKTLGSFYVFPPKPNPLALMTHAEHFLYGIQGGNPKSQKLHLNQLGDRLLTQGSEVHFPLSIMYKNDGEPSSSSNDGHLAE